MLRPTQSVLSPAQGCSGSTQVRAAPCSAWQLEVEVGKPFCSPLYRCIYRIYNSEWQRYSSSSQFPTLSLSIPPLLLPISSMLLSQLPQHPHRLLPLLNRHEEMIIKKSTDRITAHSLLRKPSCEDSHEPHRFKRTMHFTRNHSAREGVICNLIYSDYLRCQYEVCGGRVPAGQMRLVGRGIDKKHLRAWALSRVVITVVPSASWKII